MTQTMLLRSVFLFCMVFPYTVFAKLDGRQMIRESASSDTDNSVQEVLERDRERRSVASVAWKGMKAAKKLLKGAKNLPSDDKLIRVYEKKGTYRTVVKQFKSVSPEDTSEFSLPSGNKGMFGVVGDRTIMIEKKGDTGYPTMLIIRNMGFAKEGKDKIIYVPRKGFFKWLFGKTG